ncbi:MAG: hypothetical protein F4W68_00640 [Cenarchaeum sp. SB0661_bin_35]|nr:hypothetical protein [Cenarchaeum sp. SB0667_bin_13]MXZ93110.1 hypothetical protein [Cenarchaeum sp. SB0666_bin_15]MYB46415.1 hypothetical protein [Cenarchaeum sp. SB0662_bin_33]MYC79007.1 hypothetical protein [Cenarchaeum sp. SB0661_bin_35]MYD58365.1 hypothetical protein [Cenarchaeum sp. SB0678_bin_8]MYG33473.1 hypothetical protein [Cenarchaeum sp. SB0677_bin_16]
MDKSLVPVGGVQNNVNRRLLIKHALQYSMRGLCHTCLTSNVEIAVTGGKILCAKCSSITEEPAGNER